MSNSNENSKTHVLVVLFIVLYIGFSTTTIDFTEKSNERYLVKKVLIQQNKRIDSANKAKDAMIINCGCTKVVNVEYKANPKMKYQK